MEAAEKSAVFLFPKMINLIITSCYSLVNKSIQSVQEAAMNEEGTGQEPNTQTGQEPEAKTFDAEYVKKLRAEAAEWRTKAQEATGKLKEFETAQMTEAERLQKEAAEAKAQLEQAKAEAQKAKAKAAITHKAAQAGINPDLAERLIDVQFGANGEPTNLDAAFTDLLGKHPYLKVGFGGSSTNPQRQAGLTREVIQKMTPAEYLARKDEVDRFLATSQ